MRDAAFIIALQEPKIANLIFMDSKIISNLLGRKRRATAPSIILLHMVFFQNPHLRFVCCLARGWSVQRAMLEELLCVEFTPCLDPSEPESAEEAPGCKSQAEVLLSLPHVLAQHSPA